MSTHLVNIAENDNSGCVRDAYHCGLLRAMVLKRLRLNRHFTCVLFFQRFCTTALVLLRLFPMTQNDGFYDEMESIGQSEWNQKK